MDVAATGSRTAKHRSKDDSETIRKFPLTTHVGNADEEVEDYELERTTVICFIHREMGSPDGIEVSPMQLEEGTTAPEMMLLPYMSEPATGSRISMSTGGTPTKAMMKQIVANRVGIIRTPNQPT